MLGPDAPAGEAAAHGAPLFRCPPSRERPPLLRARGVNPEEKAEKASGEGAAPERRAFIYKPENH